MTACLAVRKTLRRALKYPFAFLRIFLCRRPATTPRLTRAMCYLLTLGVRQQMLDAIRVGFVDLHFAAQLALTLTGFFRQDMTTVGLTAFEAIRCFAKTLRRSPLSFQLGHDRLLIYSPAHKHRPGILWIPAARRCRRGGRFL